MFTLKPGSCLISSAKFFASPLMTAANMIDSQTVYSNEKEEKEKGEGEG